MKKIFFLSLLFIFSIPFTSVFATELDGNYVSISSFGLKTPFSVKNGDKIEIVYKPSTDFATGQMKIFSPTNSVVVQSPSSPRDIIKTWSFILDSDYSFLQIGTNSSDGTLLNRIYEIKLNGITVHNGVSFISNLSPITNLNQIHNYNSVTLSWTIPNDSIGTIIKKDGVQIADLPNTQSSFTVSGLNSESTYDFEVIAKYADNITSPGETISVTTDAMPEDITPPPNISNIFSSVSGSVVTFTYDLPIDTDFSHLQIYRNGTLIEENYTSNIFEDLSLQHNTTYTYKFVSVDKSNNISSGYVITIKTEPEIDSVPPDVPTNILIKNGFASAKVSWSQNIEPDLAGYNVYLNGIKANSSLIFANSFIFTNLENGITYDVQVSAVDTSGNESLLSFPLQTTPDAESMPIFDMSYDLKSVSDGTASWFTSLWPLLAFSVGITLAFIIASRVKNLFMS